MTPPDTIARSVILKGIDKVGQNRRSFDYGALWQTVQCNFGLEAARLRPSNACI